MDDAIRVQLQEFRKCSKTKWKGDKSSSSTSLAKLKIRILDFRDPGDRSDVQRRLNPPVGRWNRNGRTELDHAGMCSGPALEEEAAVRIVGVDLKAKDAAVEVWIGFGDVEAALRVDDVLIRNRADDRAAEDVIVGVVGVISSFVLRAAYSFVRSST